MRVHEDMIGLDVNKRCTHISATGIVNTLEDCHAQRR